MQVDILKRVDDQGIFLPPSFDVSSVHNFNEWFEEVEQLTINDIDWNFDPKPGDICYCVDNAGNILSWIHAAEEEKAEVAMGNCFRTWQETLSKGLSECLRVVKPGCVVAMKWSEGDIKTIDILKVLPQQPTFGDKTGKTRWLFFVKGSYD